MSGIFFKKKTSAQHKRNSYFNKLKNSGNPIVVLPEIMSNRAIYFLFSTDRSNTHTHEFNWLQYAYKQFGVKSMTLSNNSQGGKKNPDYKVFLSVSHWSREPEK